MVPWIQLGKPLPRARHAHASPEKWRRWVLAARGHGGDWGMIFAVEIRDASSVWRAIAQGALTAPVRSVRNRSPHGIVCGVVMTVTLNGRTAAVVTAWHYIDCNAAPRLVTAYPRT